MFQRLFTRKPTAPRAVVSSMLGMEGARDLFEVEAMEPRILLSAAPIDAPQAISNVSAVPETQTASALMVQHSPATASEIGVPTSVDTSHVFGATTHLPAIDFKTQETTSAELQIDPVCTEIEVVVAAQAAPTLSTGANTFIAHEDAKITVPSEPVVVSMTTEMVTTLRAANGPPTLEDSTTPVVNQISLTSTSAPLSAEVVSIQAPILEGESSSNVGIPAAAAATPAQTFPLDFNSAHLGDSAPVAAESPLEVFAARETKLSILSPQSLTEQGNAPLGVSSVQVPLTSYTGFAQSQLAPSQVVIVDPAVPNYLELIQGIVGASGPAIAGPTLATSTGGPMLQVSRYGDIEVVVLDPSIDGIRQISEILRPYHGLLAVQILSHGGAGSLRLGNSELDQNRLTAEQSQIAGWGTALKSDGDILLYGCDVASGTLGSRFVQNLARTTGADVAASTDSTGGTSVGGDWSLEYSSGPIEAQPVFTAEALANYGSLLNQLTNLDSYIADLLATESASFTSTELLGAAALGGFLELNGLTLTFNATLTGSVWSGTVSISATSATLYKGKNFNGSINPNVEGDAAITGTYTIGSGYALTIPATSSLVIRLGEALTISASGVSFTYNPSGPVSQTLATLQTATVFSEQFTGLPTATLSNFALRGDGFSFDAVTLTSAPAATPKIGEFLTTTGAVLTASAFNVFFGNTATNAPATLSGTVGLTLTGVKLFPKGDLIQFSALGVTAAYSFANFDGVSATGRLSLTVSGFNLAIGDALLLTTGGTDVVLSPGQAVLVTIASATLSSPKFSGLGTLAVSNLEIRRDGFSLGSLSWSSTQPVTIGGDVLTVDQVSVTLSSLSLQYGATPVISGSVSFTADAVVLFPNIPLLNLHLGSLSGSFDFGTLALPLPGLMSLQIPNLNIPLGDGLTIHLGDVNLNPGQFTMLSVPSVELSFGFFTGLPNFTLPKFDLTQKGFELGDFSVTGLNIKIGDFMSFANVTIAGVGFKVNKSLTPLISGSITISVGAMSLFPGNVAVTSTFTNLSGSFDFANVLNPGQLKLTADSFSLNLFGKISLTANTITLTPALETLVTIGSASLTFPSLSNIVINVTDLALKRHGFSFATASANLPDLDLGGLLTLQTPTVTLSNINYTFGGSLSGSVGFSTTGGSLHLGAALDASVGASSGSYNIASGELALTLANFSLSLPNFAEVRATTLALSYIPVTGGTSELTVGASGVSGFIGVGFGGANPIGVQLSAGKLGLALFKSATNVITYALDASGTVALLGLPANSLTITAGKVEFRKNTAGLINRSVNLDGIPANNILLDFPSNEESAMGAGIGLSVGTFVTLSGDFGFKKVTDANGTLIKIGAKNVNATLAAGGVSLTVQGASLGLVLKLGVGNAATTYALITQGGTDTLNGVPGLTLSATGLQVRVRNGLDPAAITGSVATPGGDVNLDFSGLAGTGNVTDVQGNVTLVVDNFVSLTGSFGFQKYTDANGTVLAIGATNLSIVLGTATTNLTLANASFGLVVKPGVSGAAATYALQANGSSVLADTSLNGVPGLTLNAKDLLVRVRKGLDLSAAVGLPTIQTPGGPVILDFADLGPGVTDLTDIQGHLKLLVDGFASLEGDFGFQSIRDGQTGAKQIAIGATNLNIIVGTATTNVTLTGATVGLVINPAVGLGVTTFALQATAASVALNGVDGLQLSATQVQVRVRRGLDLSAITGLPAIRTSGGDVTLDFSSLGTGTSDVTDVQGVVTLTVVNGTTEFVKLTGSLGFQKYTSGADNYLAFGIKGNLSLSGGGVTFGIANMSLGVLVKQTGGITTYALQAAGSSNPADTTFNGVSGLSLSASNLLLLVRRGLDVSTYPAGVPTSIQTPTGPIIMNFGDLGPGTSPVTVIQGHLTLSVDGFASLEGDFGFQKFVVGVSGSGLAIGGKNIKVVLGTAETNLTVTDATLGLVVQAGNYALMASAGTVTLNGVPDLTLGGNSLLVRIKHGLDPPSLVGLPTQVPTSAGAVTLDFSGLGATDVMEIQGTATINVANFVSLSGTFSFSKQTTGTVTKILAGASGVNAYIGTADGLLGVQIAGASLGLVIYRDSTAAGSKYALQASAPSITVLGLPSEITLTGAASVAINTTGAVVNEPIPGTAVTVAFATATNIKSFGGSLTLGVGTSFSLSGNFSFSKTVVGTVTKVLIGATNIGNALGTTVAADGDPGTTFNLSDGSLGLVLYKNGAVSQGYALSASATATVALGSALSGKATLTLRRNATVSAQNDIVTVGATSIPLVFTAAEVKVGVTAFQSIALSNASLTIDDSLIITANSGSGSTPTAGAASTILTGISLTVQDPATANDPVPHVLFTISAGSAVYTTFSGPVTTVNAIANGLKARGDAKPWALGDKLLVLSNVSFTIGGTVTFTAASVVIQHYSAGSPLVVVNSFDFVGATITFLKDGKSLVSLSGDPKFHITSGSLIPAENGFKLDSFLNPGFAFLEQTSEVSGMTVSPGASISVVPPPPTPRKLGPLTLLSPSVSLSNFSFAFSGDVSAVVTIGALSAELGTPSSPGSAVFTNLTGSFEVGLHFDLSNPLALPTNLSAEFKNVKFASMVVSFGTTVKLTATNVILNPTAGATEDFISFNSLSASLDAGSVHIVGTASMFAIEGDGSFLAKPGFAVSLSASDATGLGFPAFFPLTSIAVTLKWANFNAHPDQFIIQLSAAVGNIGGLGLTVNGSITNVVIDPQLLADGKFPIVSIDSAAVSVSGNLVGGEISGTLIFGVIRFDSDGKLVDGLGNLTGTTTAGTAPFKSAFYTGIAASFDIGGTLSFTARIGLSEFGLLQIYVEAGLPIPLGPTGLFLSDFRGGITFGSTFPTIPITGSASDALALRQPAFNTPDKLTASQWEAQLRTQVAKQYHDNPSGGFAAPTGPFIIQAGVTIYAANKNAFRIEGDILIDTSGKILVLGNATFASGLTIGAKLFTDLSEVFAGTSNSASLLFLIEVPAQSALLPAVQPIYSIYGVITITDTPTEFKISVAGAVEYNILDAVKVRIEATLTLTFTADSFTITLANGALYVPEIQAAPLGTAAGEFTIRNTNGVVDVWGGVILIPDLTFLEDLGITVGGQVFIKLNTSSDLKHVTLQINSQPMVLDLKPESFSLFIVGHADFKIANAQVFRLDGTIAVEITNDHLSIFVSAQLLLGDPSSPLLTFNANGLVYVQLKNSVLVQAGFAAKLTLTQGVNVPNGITFGVNWLLVMNTTQSEISYEIPAPLPTTPPSPDVATIMGPDYSSTNPLALVSYEVIAAGVRTLVIPAGAPASGLSDYKTWTPAQPNSYLIIVGRGSITIADVFTLTGGINIVATVSGTAVSFTLEANANLAIKLNGNTVFSFAVAGGIQISNAGVAAALTMSYSAGFSLPSGLGFGLTASFLLKLNTTNAPVTLAGIAIPTGPNNLFAQIHAVGHLTFLGNVVDLNGTFDITVTGTSLTVSVDASLTFLGATFKAHGFAGIYYDSNPGLALRIQLSLPGGAEGIAPVAALGSSFAIKGTFTIELNTSSISRPDAGHPNIAPGFRVSVTNLGVYLFGFNLTGSLSIGISSAGFSIDVQSLNLNLFGLANINLSGYYHPNGDFKFTGTASFQFGDHTFGIGGTISVTISNSGFSASVSGWVAAFTIEVKAGGSISISGGSVDISVYISLQITPAIHIHTNAVKAWGVTIWPAIDYTIPAVVISGTANFHLGTTSPPPNVAAVIPPPTPPALAGVNSSGQLVLYLGQDVGNRVSTDSTHTLTPALLEEVYSLTRVAGDPGSTGGRQTIRVSALGFQQDYPNVSSILVSNTLSGNDRITIDNLINVPVNMTLGSGSNVISTGSGPATINLTGPGNSQVNTGSLAIITLGSAASGSNQINVGAGSSVIVNGNGSNSIGLTNGGTAASTFTINGTGNNRINVTGGAPTITIANSATGINTVVASSGSAMFVHVNGSGANSITATGGGAATISVAGSGPNQVVIGSSPGTITVTGNGANNITTGSGLASVYLRGAGANAVNGGAGYLTLYDQGIGGSTIRGGIGGGIYLGGLTLGGTPYATKGSSSLNTVYGNFSVDIKGYSNYALSNSAVVYGDAGFSLALNGVRFVTLTADSAPPANQFTLVGWSYGANLVGAGSDNTLLMIPAAEVSGVNYVLTDSSLQVSGGVTQTIAFSGIQTANLVGANTGTNQYDITAWTGNGTLSGPQGSSNILVAVNDVADFTLSDTLFTRTGHGDMTLAVIQFANLTGGSSSNTFTVNNWSGGGDLDGKGAGDIYNITLSGNGTGILNVADSGPSGIDQANIKSSRTTLVTSNLVRVGTQRVNYSGIEQLNVTGGAGGLVYNTQGTNVITNTTIQTFGNANTINVGSTAGLLPISPGILHGILGPLTVIGGGQDLLNLDDTGDSIGHTDGQLTGTKITGLGMVTSGITYSGIQALTLAFGAGGDTFAILSTHTGATTVNANGGIDTINIRTISGTTTVNTGDANDIINVGTLAPAIGGNVNLISASLIISGGAGADTTNIDDRSDTLANTGYLTATQLTGLGMAVGITYDTLETLNIDTGSGDDVFNIRGTSAVTHIALHNGNEQIYISSLANVAVGDPRPDFLSGNLSAIQGTLTLDAGAGRHQLFISDATATLGDAAVTITKGAITGLAPVAINYSATGNFADGITIWAGSGNDVVSVTSTHQSAGFNEITTLNTGAGGDLVNVNLSALTDGTFVLNTEAGNDAINASTSTLGLVIFGGQGDDAIVAGAGNDLIFGDSGRVEYFNALGAVVTVLGGGGPGDKTDGVLRPVSHIFTVTPLIGGEDTITSGNGLNIILGGNGSDNITGGTGIDIVIGDSGDATFDITGVLTRIQTTDAGVKGVYNDTINLGIGNNVVLAGNGSDRVTTTTGNDLVIGDNGRATFNNVAGVSVIREITSTDITIGGLDIINVGEGNNIIIGGGDNDQITGGSGSDIGTGDYGHAIFNATGILTFIETISSKLGSDDIISVGDGDNIILGGEGKDTIIGGDDRDVILGDNGNATFSDTGILLDIISTDTAIGGNDLIIAGNGLNIILGGFGADDITGGSDRDVVLGDNGHATFNTAGILTFITTISPEIGGDDVIKVGNGDNIILGGAGKDTITGGGDRDVILGDNGNATFSATGILLDIISTDTAIGGNDIITAGNGLNIILGGFGADDITGGSDRDVVLGDNGHAIFNTAGILTFITTISPEIGGDDLISVGNGDNIVLGGAGKDTITGGANRDVILGDNGNATFSDTGILFDIISTDTAIGGNDVITAGNGLNIILAGFGADDITGGSDRDVVLGDNGHATFNTAGILTFITTISPEIDGDDIVKASNGDNIILGGAGKDTITGGANRDVIFGDNGNATFSATGILLDIISTDTAIGGNDIITAGSGLNIILGGFGADDITGGSDRDVVLGDNGHAIFNTAGILTFITTLSPEIGGDDVIKVGNGDNIILGGAGKDTITGGANRDVILGDNGNATFSDTGILLDIISTDTAIGGNDLITAGNGLNIILGGFGADDITGGSDRDVVLGDNGHAQFNSVGDLTFITTISPEIGGDDMISVGNGDNFVFGGAGRDTITGGDDRDVILGDNGNATFSDTGILTFITTSDPSIGGDDIIDAGNGLNIIIGGIGADQITGGTGRDIVVGDNGNATFDDTGVLTLIRTSDAAVLGNYDDTILLDRGDNLVLAGNGNDYIVTTSGHDVIVGDNGRAIFVNLAGASHVRDIISTDTAIGGHDIIDAGIGNNVVIGGFGRDYIITDSGSDFGTGDNGHAIFNNDGILTFIETISPSLGDNDLVYLGAGNNVFLGGFGSDEIISLGGDDVIFGDNGNASFSDTGILIFLTTSQPSIGGDDIITAGDGFNIILGGFGADFITGGANRDFILGDNGKATFNTSGVLTYLTTTQPAIGGNDSIDAGDGSNVILGGFGADTIIGGNNRDVILGDNGRATFNLAGDLTYIVTTQPLIGGEDTIFGGDGYNFIFGGYGTDFITGGSSRDFILGDNGYAFFDDASVITDLSTSYTTSGSGDLIDAGPGNDVVFGGRGRDTIAGSEGRDVIVGDNGHATFDPLWSITYLTTYNRESGDDDIIFGDSGDDLIFGGGGNDIIDSGSGDDTIIGDLGDYNIGSSNPRGVTLFREANGGNDIILGGDGDDLILSGGGNDIIDGGSGRDTLFAGYGNDLAYGGTGDDIVVGGPDGDFLDGGFDHDTLYVDVFDTWAGGMFEDTIVGGPFFSSGLTYINGPIYHFGNTLAGSAAGNLARAFARLTQLVDDGVGEIYITLADVDLSTLLDSSILESLMDHGFDSIRWGGVGGTILALAARELATPSRLSHGGIVEQQWSELLALAN